MQQPTIGRIVRYKDAQGIVYPAIITVVDQPNEELTLTVFDNSMTTPGVKVSYQGAEGPRQAIVGAWWWPERI